MKKKLIYRSATITAELIDSFSPLDTVPLTKIFCLYVPHRGGDLVDGVGVGGDSLATLAEALGTPEHHTCFRNSHFFT